MMAGTPDLRHDRLRVVIDARAIGPHFPGIGRATLGLLRGLHVIKHGTEIVVVFRPEQRDLVTATGIDDDPRFHLVPVASSPQSLSQQWRLPASARRMHARAWHATYYFRPFFGLPPTIVTIFDLIGPASLHTPSRSQNARSRVEHAIWKLAMRLSVRSAACIITSSEATRYELEAAYPSTASKIVVIPLAADEHFRPASAEQIGRVRQQYALPERYVLYHGSNKPHKNILGLLDAWTTVLATNGVDDDTGLVLSGRESPRLPSARNRARELGIGDRIRFLPDLPDEDLPALLSGSLCFVFPSLQEGFGLPPLEAMACGAPVLVANRSSLPEVVGDAGMMVEPEPAALADGMRRLLADNDLRAMLRQRGLARAARFSWSRTAAETLAVYHQVARA